MAAMLLSILTSFLTISSLVYSAESAVNLPDCANFDKPDKNLDLENLVVNLAGGEGLVVESFCWQYDSKDVQNEGHLHQEYLFDKLIHFEMLPKNQQQKMVIVVNGTKHAFEATLTSEMATTKCEGDVINSVAEWKAGSLDLMSDLIKSSNHISLSWILANLNAREWIRKDNAEQGLATFVSCASSGVEIQLTFLNNGKNPIKFDNLIQVLVVPEDKDTNGYSLFDVYNVDKIDPADTNPVQMQQSLGIFQPPEGIACVDFMSRDQVIVQFPNQMSMSTELVDFNNKHIYYTSEFYDYEQKLVRIELHNGYTPGYVSPRHSNPREEVDPIMYIRDFEYNLGFWRDTNTGDCGIHEMSTGNMEDVSKELYPETVDFKNDQNVSEHAKLFKMYHPYEIYDFTELFYTGRCLSQSYVTGFRYIHVDSKSQKLTEVCFADGTWVINTLNSSISLPFYRKTYDLNQARKAPDFTPYVSKVTHFYDVEFHEPDPSYFDISDCIDSKDERHYILKTRSSTKLLNQEGVALPDDQQRSPLFKKMPRYTAAMKGSLQKLMNLPGVRLFDVFAEEPLTAEKETSEHSVLIGFAILDFPATMSNTFDSDVIDTYRGRGIYQTIRDINKTIYAKLDKNDFVLNFEWEDYYRSVDGKTVNGTFREKMRVEKIVQVTKSAFESQSSNTREVEAPSEGGEGGGIGAGAIVAVAFCMMLLGVGIGMALGWKLWKSGTSFGYTIHTNI